MKKHILSLITLSSVVTTPSYCVETPSEITSQLTHSSISAQEIDVDFDTQIALGHTREARINDLLENYEKILASIDKSAEELDFPLLKYYGFTYLNIVNKCRIFNYKDRENLDKAFKRQSIEDAIFIQNLFKREIQKVAQKSRNLLSCDPTATPQLVHVRAPYSSYADMPLDQKLNISHGGNFFYILRFLLGMGIGYPLEAQDGLGIQVTPSIPDTAEDINLAYKPYH